jgi:hypothetical protein
MDYQLIPNDILRRIYVLGIKMRNVDNFESGLEKSITDLDLYKEITDTVGFTTWENWCQRRGWGKILFYLF